MSQQPQLITLNAVVSTGATTDFHPSFCVNLKNGTRSCSYNAAQFLPPGARLNQLRTFTKNSESDAGAEITLEIDPAFACVPREILEEIWGVPPTDGAIRLYDFFAGTEARPDVKNQFYYHINTAAPYVFAEASSIGECIKALRLSAIHPPYN